MNAQMDTSVMIKKLKTIEQLMTIWVFKVHEKYI